MNKQERREYNKAYYQAHKEKIKASAKAWRAANKEQKKEQNKAYYAANKEQCKAYYKAHKEQYKAYQKVYKKEYTKNEVNALGQTKSSIRQKSQRYLNKYGTKIPGYQIHHCCTYTEPYKFIYCSKEMHLLIHSYLKQHNIDADSDHYEQIKHLLDDSVFLYNIQYMNEVQKDIFEIKELLKKIQFLIDLIK